MDINIQYQIKIYNIPHLTLTTAQAYRLATWRIEPASYRVDVTESFGKLIEQAVASWPGVITLRQVPTILVSDLSVESDQSQSHPDAATWTHLARTLGPVPG
jgi:hypothetical protein